MLSQAVCQNCGATNPAGKVLCVLCGKPLSLGQSGAGTVHHGAPATQATASLANPSYTQQAYIPPAYATTQQLAGLPAGYQRNTPIPARAGERFAIGILKTIGWFWLIVSTLIALGVLLLGLGGFSQLSQYASGLAYSQLLVVLVVAVVILMQGLGIWAVTHVGASIAQSLIIIRLNTA